MVEERKMSCQGENGRDIYMELEEVTRGHVGGGLRVLRLVRM